jgi:hypothetical protein
MPKKTILIGLLLSLSLASRLAAASTASPEPGLLFYVSGDHGTAADFSSGGTPAPNFDTGITSILDGAKGAALRCSDLETLSWWAPGNIYAQRGTLSFFWRPHTPVGATAFPVFRVGYADHSSWDMVFLRIDYNGHGFDAFVTDASLARTRVSVTLDPMPPPDQWIHLALAWDETRGIRFYIDGRLAAVKETTAIYNAGLDQFGPHMRIASPWHVQSDYNFVRGGDIDELRIYDRMLADDNVAALARGDVPTEIPPAPSRDLSDTRWRDEWAFRYGWNRPADPPPYLRGAAISIRKVEIHDAYDFKRWYWKATDGIRETTWPGVYNRSRLPGRNDYFQLPDWDCYSLSGKSITFTMPDEPWNHLEISGAAWGSMTLVPNSSAESRILFERPQGQEKTVHTLPKPIFGQKIRFDNLMQEEPIGELSAYYVTEGREPAGSAKLAYRLAAIAPSNPSLQELATFIAGREPPDERSTLVAVPAGSSATAASAAMAHSLPLVHILIPNDAGKPAYRLDAVDGGLDGIAIDLPALAVEPTVGDLFPLNIQVKDPLWPMRDMLDFTFSVKPGEAKTLWLDLRDRILPPGKSLYVTIAGSGGDFGAASLAGAQIRLVFKPKKAALAEDELDRFTQARDAYAMLVEEHPDTAKYNLWNRFAGDIKDLMRVDPNHYPGRNYYAVAFPGTPWPAMQHPAAPKEVPLWASRQVEALGHAKYFVNWWIDNRQIENGEYGGGLSDDTDLTNMWPGVALMGCDPEKIGKALERELDACYREGMFTNGLCSIQADELHGYEEGINCLGQNLIVNYGSPRMLERAMETARGLAWLTAVNPAGNRLFQSCYYNGVTMATDSVWGYTKMNEYLILQPSQLLVEFNGNPSAKKLDLEMADGLLAHRRKDKTGHYVLPSSIHFVDDKETFVGRTSFPWYVFWSAYKWTGDRKYLDPLFDGSPASVMMVNANLLDLLDLRQTVGPRIVQDKRGPEGAAAGLARRQASPTKIGHGDYGSWYTPEHFEWQLTGDKSYLESLYDQEIHEDVLGEYINTEGSLWIDRVGMPTAELQRARLGAIALTRGNVFPGHVISWKFAAPATDQSLAILVPQSTPTAFKVIAYNLETKTVHARMTGWNVDPGLWEVTQGIDTQGADRADRDLATRTVPFERSVGLDLTFAPRATTVLTFTLKQEGTPYWQRPDLGIDLEDVVVHGREVLVRVHSVGAAPTPESSVVFRDRTGRIVAADRVPPLPAPLDLMPKTVNVRLCLPDGLSAAGGTVEIDPDHRIEEITRLNNIVHLPESDLPDVLENLVGGRIPMQTDFGDHAFEPAP